MISKLKTFELSVLFILLASLIYKFICFQEYSQTNFYNFLRPDEFIYHKAALSFLKDGSIGGDTSYLSVFLIYWVSFLYEIFGASFLPVRIANIIFHLLAALLCVNLSHKIFGKKVAIISLLLFVFYQPLTFLSLTYLKELYNSFLLLVIMNLLYFFFQKKQVSLLLLASMFLGVIFFSRSQNFVLFFALWITFVVLYFQKYNSLKETGLYLLSTLFGFLLIALPVAIQDSQVNDSYAVNGGFAGCNIYVGNSTLTTSPYWSPIYFAQGTHKGIKQGCANEARRLSGQDLTDSQASNFLIKQTIKEFDFNMFKKILSKVHALISNSEYGENYNIKYFAKDIPALNYNFNYFGIVFIAGFIALVRTRRKNPFHLMLLIACIFYTLSLIVIFPNARHRLPLFILLLPFAAEFIYFLIGSLYRKQFNCRYLIAFFALLPIAIIPVSSASDVTHMLNAEGYYMLQNRRFDEAIPFFQKSMAEQGLYSDYAKFQLAAHHLRKKDLEKAAGMLAEIGDKSVAVSQRDRMLQAIENRKGILDF